MPSAGSACKAPSQTAAQTFPDWLKRGGGVVFAFWKRLSSPAKRRRLPFPGPPQYEVLDFFVQRRLTPSYQSRLSLAVDMTVNALMGEQDARIGAGFRAPEMIEWE